METLVIPRSCFTLISPPRYLAGVREGGEDESAPSRATWIDGYVRTYIHICVRYMCEGINKKKNSHTCPGQEERLSVFRVFGA